MRNSLGNPARGDAFYQRDQEIKRIYRVLSTGTSIYLSAPRRVGKTSILKYIEEFPINDHYFIYVITESVDSEKEFFKVIFEGLIKSDAIGRMAKASDSIKGALESILNRVKKVYNVEIREAGETDYYEILIDLFSHIKKEYGKVVILIDEFPQTIQNILNKYDEQAAERFIQRNRQLRHHENVHDKISFIYTGSMSLYPMVQKVTSLTSVNDLRTVEIGPLSFTHAKDFISRLLSADEVFMSNDLLEYTLQKMGWLIPFHLQLIAQEIVEVFETTGKPIDAESIDQAFDQVVHSRNKPQFEPYFARLATLFKGVEHVFVFEVLEYIASNDQIDNDDLYNMGVKNKIEDVKRIMDILEGDGYLFRNEENKVYRYTSPILQMWCQKHICK